MRKARVKVDIDSKVLEHWRSGSASCEYCQSRRVTRVVVLWPWPSDTGRARMANVPALLCGSPKCLENLADWAGEDIVVAYEEPLADFLAGVGWR
jgi:hypothetical protein